jgi:hypothetical protein
MAENCLFL